MASHLDDFDEMLSQLDSWGSKSPSIPLPSPTVATKTTETVATKTIVPSKTSTSTTTISKAPTMAIVHDPDWENLMQDEWDNQIVEKVISQPPSSSTPSSSTPSSSTPSSSTPSSSTPSSSTPSSSCSSAIKPKAPQPQKKENEEEDGLDMLLAQASASKSSNNNTKTTLKGRSVAAGTVRLEDRVDIAPIVRQFVGRLRQFQYDLADPVSIKRINATLWDECDFEKLLLYYNSKPELCQYTINTEVHRMNFSVDMGSGKVLDDKNEIKKELTALCAQTEGISTGFGGFDDKGGATGLERDMMDKMMLLRMSNQSLLADMMNALRVHLIEPHDPHGELNVAIRNSGYVKCHMDMKEKRLVISSVFSIATVGDDAEMALALATITGEIIVSMRTKSMEQRVHGLELSMIFDDDLLRAAQSLAQWASHSHDDHHDDNNNNSNNGLVSSSLRLFGLKF